MLQDNILAMLGINYKLADQSIMEIQVYGTKDGKTLFYSRAHQMEFIPERPSKGMSCFTATAI